MYNCKCCKIIKEYLKQKMKYDNDIYNYIIYQNLLEIIEEMEGK